MSYDGGAIDGVVFIEGRALGFSRVTTTERLGDVTRCSLTLPYDASGRRIEARALVHVFCSDPDRADFPHTDAAHNYASGPVLNLYQGRDPRHYKLLFWGELAGRGSLKDRSGNDLQLELYGFSNYFDSIKQYQALRGRGTFSDVERRLAGVLSRLSGSRRDGDRRRSSQSSAETDDEVVSEGRTGQYATADYLIELFRSNGGDIQKGVTTLIREFIDKTNRFYKNRYTTLRIQNMVRSIENDGTSAELMDLEIFRRFLRQQIGSVGYQITIRDIVQILGGFIFHDLVEHATPTYFPSLSDTAAATLDSSDVDPQVPGIDRSLQHDYATGVVFKPETWWTAPPACNILFPEQYTRFQESDLRISEPTRTIMKVQPGVNGDRRTIADDYFAPNLQALNDLVTQSPEADQHFFLLPHERFRGLNLNVVFINELQRLVSRDSAQNYLRSYAQFLHWRTAYATRQLTVVSERLLPQVLVGYPAVVLDSNSAANTNTGANTPERMRLLRERAMLQRALATLQSRLAGVLHDINEAGWQAYWLAWLKVNGQIFAALGETVENGVTFFSLAKAYQSSPAFQTGPSILSGSAQVLLDIVSSGAASRTQPGANVENPFSHELDRPQPSASWLRAHLGEAAQPLTPDNLERITGDPSSVEIERLIEQLLERIISIVAALRALADQLRKLIAAVEEALRQIAILLRDLLPATGRLEHWLFYVTQKTIEIQITGQSGSVLTTLSGAFARTHDEDIDLDGTMGDSFERIIQLGTGGFFSEIYSPGQIGTDFYLPMYGVKSVVDIGADALASSIDLGAAAEEETIVDDGPTWQPLIDQIDAALRDEVPPGAGSGVTEAVEAIVTLYRTMKQVGNQDVDSFVRAVTARPIATMLDVIGAANLPMTPESAYGNYRGANQDGRQAGVGFHEFAFLKEDGTFDTSGLEDGESGESLDVATTRRHQVDEYAAAILHKEQLG